MLQFEHITTNPKILAGKPIIKDTRISVEFILELLASGAAVKDIVEAYPHLSEEAVKEAILFNVEADNLGWFKIKYNLKFPSPSSSHISDINFKTF